MSGVASFKETERKKNTKLKYQRTPVACRHCRKRKIRCQPNEDDITAPCVNCLRTGKECVIVPIQDTPNPGDRIRPRTDTSPTVPMPSLPRTVSQSRSTQPLPAPQATRPFLHAHESSYDTISSRPLTTAPYTTYPNHLPALHHNESMTNASWGQPPQAYTGSTPALAPVSSHLPSSYYSAEPNYLTSSHSSAYDHSQQSFQPYEPSVASSSASTIVPSRASRGRSMSYQAPRPYSPAMPGPPFDGLRRVVTMQQPSTGPMQSTSPESSYADAAPFSGPSGTSTSYNGAAHQSYGWPQYGQQDQYQEQPGYGGHHQWS